MAFNLIVKIYKNKYGFKEKKNSAETQPLLIRHLTGHPDRNHPAVDESPKVV